MICAYYDPSDKKQPCHDLALHSLRVASLAAIISDKKLTGNNPLFAYFRDQGCKIEPKGIAVLSGLLHDLGKASGFYQRNLERGFGFHEHVAGIVLSRAAEVGQLSGDIAGWRLLRLASYVITRHHVAMVNRHPDSLVNNRRASCVIERALKELNPDTLSQMGLDLFLPRGINDYIRESLSSLKRDNKLISRYLSRNTTRNIVEDEFCDAGGLDPSQGYRLLKTVQVLAGILIVSDILVAWKERGPKDPGRLYARSWLAELNVEKSLEEIASLNNPSQIYSKYLKYNTTRVVGP